jgi:hypothetical protein
VENIPTTLPKDWRKLPNINNNIIKAGPFCQQMPRRNPIGNLEHLHQYCSSNVLQRARIHCNQRIEHALHNIYNCASINEYGRELHEEIRYTRLQEHLISAAIEAELQMRPIVRDSRLLYEQRNQNQAIKAQNEVQISVLLQRLPPAKLEEYIRFPLSAQLGFIHAIPEDTYDIATASITEVSFIGLFPKQIYHVLRSYGKQHPAIAAEFNNLIEDLISAFVYQPLTMQKVIHILIARQKEILAQ